MIWHAGQLVPDDALTVSVHDRTFEHGLGLFETLRTWGGRAPLLARHLERMTRSAEALGLPLRGVVFPDDEAVSSLLNAEATGDRVLRIVLSGGTSEDDGATLWMTSKPLTPPAHPSISVAEATWNADRDDALSRHKTLNYWARRRAFERAKTTWDEEILSRTADGSFWEGSRANLFVVRRDRLYTPSLRGPIVPGVMRALVLEIASGTTLKPAETDGLRPCQVDGADEVFLTNSVRGIIPVDRVGPRRWRAPGPWTTQLADLVNSRLTTLNSSSFPPF